MIPKSYLKLHCSYNCRSDIEKCVSRHITQTFKTTFTEHAIVYVLFLKIIILKVITFKFNFISIYSNVEFIMEGQIVTEITAKDFNEKKDIMI